MSQDTTEPLTAMCHEAVRRIRSGQTRYDEELDRLCEQFGEKPEIVGKILDQAMRESSADNKNAT